VQTLHLWGKGRAACHYTDGRRALSAFIASRPIRWQAASRSSSRRRACWVCWQTVHPCQAAPYTRPSLPQEASPARQGYADLERQGTRRLPRQQTLEDPSSIFFMSLGPYVGAQSFCAGPPFGYKRGGIQRNKKRTLRPSSRQTLSSSYKLPSNTSHSGVGYYAPAARTTLNPRVLSCVDPPVS
jgi:hypothetical protein